MAETFFATCAPGLEPFLHAEARALRLARVEQQVGGVRFEGALADARRANLHLRTAVRVLWRVARFAASDADALYGGVRSLDWSRHLAPGASLWVDAQSTQSALDHTLFVAQRTKDAVVDRLRADTGARPDVAQDADGLRLHVHLFQDRCTLSIDTSGDSLHKRGWRREQGRAPLAETLAAAVVLASGWDRRAPLLDPFCGSGTLLVEAALLAADVAPGLFRERFAFEAHPAHDAAAWAREREAARAAIAPKPKLRLVGGERDEAVLAGARANAAAAGVGELCELELARADAADFAPKPGWNAWVVTNPPYGERVGEASALAPLYRAFGARLRERCEGYRVALLSGNAELARELGWRPEGKLPLRNGGLECELLLGGVGDVAPLSAGAAAPGRDRAARRRARARRRGRR